MSELQEFVEHIQAWHENGRAQLQTILDAPAGTEVRLGSGDDAITLTDEQLKGFRGGIATALSLLGKLPFETSSNDPDEEE